VYFSGSTAKGDSSSSSWTFDGRLWRLVSQGRLDDGMRKLSKGLLWPMSGGKTSLLSW
jgi:hypothetical protein